MRGLLAALYLLWAGMVHAEDYPALYDVRGVAADDVLNVRAGPGVGHPVIGALLPGASGIEVVSASADGRWLMLNADETAGWASAFYLQRTGPIWSFGLPTPLACFGTEPFWSLERTGAQAMFSDMGFERITLSEVWSGQASARGTDQFGAVWEGAGRRITATLRREACSDGMSERMFGLSTLVIIQTPDGVQMLSGCCALAP
ncbi:peptide-binding protein [Rhodophyticola sp.]|uniref:peptide-binding protein n=1 Tax=Rhodophyticola sp. TaxID=2680032 RepID=UPI003D28811C